MRPWASATTMASAAAARSASSSLLSVRLSTRPPFPIRTEEFHVTAAASNVERPAACRSLREFLQDVEMRDEVRERDDADEPPLILDDVLPPTRRGDALQERLERFSRRCAGGVVERDEDILDADRVPVLAVDAANRRGVDEADRASVLDDRNEAAAVTEHDVVDEIADGLAGRDGQGRARDELPDRAAAEGLAHQHLLISAARGGGEKEADEDGPEAADDAGAREEREEAERDEGVTEKRAGEAGQPRGLQHVPLHPPQDRPQNPAAIERKGRQEIEEREDQVDCRQILEKRHEPLRRAGRGRGAGGEPGDARDGHAHDRARDGDPEFRDRAFRLLLEFRHAAEKKERDAADAEPEAAREEVRPADVRNPLREVAGREAADDERRDDQPTRVDPNLEAEDVEKFERVGKHEGLPARC